MAKARDIPGLDGRHSFRAVARESVSVRAAEVFEHAAGVLDTEDIERVHDMRVATRRLRAVLEVFAAAFDRAEHKAVLRDVKELADALGARRDPDVQLAALMELEAALPEADRAGIEAFADRVRTEQRDGNATLAAALKRIADDDLRGRLERLVAVAG
ncbi:MAG TPA: CHAD domain-containing protein [Baekduia sp.]|uniref:CHAD domain-containing protein n=1 Tax=Baekduia sp. TaxID=2600305 RepID=UPI002D7A21A1|nr:CHAD domain-containing protein [Baekduia sp.]HET6506819.1 CHAD domain-containing protein [Baekduia sp.]